MELIPPTAFRQTLKRLSWTYLGLVVFNFTSQIPNIQYILMRGEVSLQGNLGTKVCIVWIRARIQTPSAKSSAFSHLMNSITVLIRPFPLSFVLASAAHIPFPLSLMEMLKAIHSINHIKYHESSSQSWTTLPTPYGCPATLQSSCLLRHTLWPVWNLQS